MTPSLSARIRRHLDAAEPRTAPDNNGVRRAAVAVCVLGADTDDPRVLIAKRVPRGLNPGQWVLPGGKLDAGETPEEAALRELHEEAGIEGAEAVGRLDDFVTDSGFVITPVVVLAPDGARPRRAPAEIASLHPIALHRLDAPGVPRWRTLPDGRPLLQMPLRHDMVIHAPTGAILLQFREVALHGRAADVRDLVQPDWTRR